MYAVFYTAINTGFGFTAIRHFFSSFPAFLSRSYYVNFFIYYLRQVIPIRLFAFSDLHLSFGSDKPMDVFKGWENHTEKILKNWNRIVTSEDVVVLAGDTSWSIDFKGAKPDFEYLHSLNGRKIILKGNHDFWWSTASKIHSFFAENKFDDVDILHNNCYTFGNIAVCGTRGWLYDGSGEADEKIIRRECGRLETSLSAAREKGAEPIVFMHYPFAYGDFVCEEIYQVLKKHGVGQVYYGHIHGFSRNNTISEYGGIKLRLVSCDCVDFTPVFVGEYNI